MRAQLQLEAATDKNTLRVSATRPLPRAFADAVCLRQIGSAIPAQARERVVIALVHSSVVIRCESRRPVMVDPGAVLVVPAWEVIAMRAAGPAPCSLQALLVRPEHLADLPSVRLALVREAAITAEVRDLFLHLERPIHSTACADRIRVVIERALAHAEPRDATRSTHATPLEPVRGYLRAHLPDDVSVQELARFSGLSASHLVRAFHREFGLPPRAYQLRLRLARASELLSAGARVSHAAYETGFADQSHLCRRTPARAQPPTQPRAQACSAEACRSLAR
jgi:AraC-like DNA-binding protein